MKHLSVAEAEQLASSCPLEEIAPFLRSPVERVLLALLGNPFITETEVLVLLNRRELPATVIKEIAQTKKWLSSYPIKRGLSLHPKTPVRISMELLKSLFVFDLVAVSLQPAVPHEVKELAENLVLSQLPKLPPGQKITLARRSTSRIAGELLRTDHPLIITAALDNPRLGEATLLQILSRPGCSTHLVEAAASHKRWSLCYDVQLALLRTNFLTMGRTLKFISNLKLSDLKEIAEDPKLSGQLRDYLGQLVDRHRRPERG
ncbi:MAG TPA: hypothetical protein VMW38_26470 [Terriglobia bacterium]|nr:hypothetical protein [Terriglobia bacterium]